MSNKAQSATDRIQERAAAASSLYEAPPAQDPSRAETAPNHPAQGGSLDTLAKSTHPPSPEADQADESRETMTRRANSKWLTHRLVDRMEEEVSDSPVPYGKARACCNVVQQEDGELRCTYCKQRWCVVCQRIRMGQKINQYLPILRGWEREDSVFFVSLTKPNVDGDGLRDEVGDMIHQFGLCVQQMRRTRGMEVKAIRCIECTYNPDREDFNPHFHVGIKGKEQALALVEEWLKRHPEAVRKAQDVTRWDGTPEGLLELVKYATKLFTPKNGERADGKVQQEPMDPDALDRVFRALRRRHLFCPLGFDLEDERERTQAEIEQSEEVDDFDEDELDATVAAFRAPEEKRVWEWDGNDWWDVETGECLTGFTPEAEADSVESNT